MKEFFYYLRDVKRRPVVTVCLLIDDDGTVFRGIAICSPLDQPDKRKGRNIARERANYALDLGYVASGNVQTLRVQRPVALGVLVDSMLRTCTPTFKVTRRFTHKACGYAELTPYESALLAKPGDDVRVAVA